MCSGQRHSSCSFLAGKLLGLLREASFKQLAEMPRPVGGLVSLVQILGIRIRQQERPQDLRGGGKVPVLTPWNLGA